MSDYPYKMGCQEGRRAFGQWRCENPTGSTSEEDIHAIAIRLLLAPNKKLAKKWTGKQKQEWKDGYVDCWNQAWKEELEQIT